MQVFMNFTEEEEKYIIPKERDEFGWERTVSEDAPESLKKKFLHYKRLIINKERYIAPPPGKKPIMLIDFEGIKVTL